MQFLHSVKIDLNQELNTWTQVCGLKSGYNGYVWTTGTGQSESYNRTWKVFHYFHGIEDVRYIQEKQDLHLKFNQIIVTSWGEQVGGNNKLIHQLCFVYLCLKSAEIFFQTKYFLLKRINLDKCRCVMCAVDCMITDTFYLTDTSTTLV